jgi:hypothetical protein
MGMEIVVESDGKLAALLGKLKDCVVMMVDGGLVMPSAPPPEKWQEVRLRTPAGTVTLKRREKAIAVVVFGNADPVLQEMQKRIAEALKP